GAAAGLEIAVHGGIALVAREERDGVTLARDHGAEELDRSEVPAHEHDAPAPRARRGDVLETLDAPRDVVEIRGTDPREAQVLDGGGADLGVGLAQHGRAPR